MISVMRLGPYSLNYHGPATLARNLLDSARVNVLGFPRLPGRDAAELCREALKRNAGRVLYAGTGHFRYMWIADFGKSLRGAYEALDASYLSRQIDFMTSESLRLGYVPSCFSQTAGFDMPWPRGDGLPWLVFCHAERLRRGGAPDPRLQRLFSVYEGTHFEGGLISKRIRGDWQDTILRPSSTYNNVCALMALKLAPALGVKTRHDHGEFENLLLESRLRDDGLTDHAETDALSVDAGVLALYLELFDRPTRERIARGLEASGAASPLPIRCVTQAHDESTRPILTRFSAGYHQSVWLHLGLMYLNGLARLGWDVTERRARVAAVFERYGNALEAVTPDGKPYRGVFLSCEHGLSMAAGQYLEK